MIDAATGCSMTFIRRLESHCIISRYLNQRDQFYYNKRAKLLEQSTMRGKMIHICCTHGGRYFIVYTTPSSGGKYNNM